MHRLAIVGFGRLAQRYYVPALRSFDAIEISAVADPLPASRAAVEGAFPGARIYSDYRDLLDHEHIDAILVASPPSTHLAIWNYAAKSRLPAFIEKPFVLPGELEHVDSSPETRRLLMPNLNRRFWPAYQRLREFCQSARIGSVQCADFNLRVNIRPWNSVTQHRLSPAEGGALYDLGSSQLDLIQYVFREKIVSLRANSRTVLWPADQISLSIKLESGVLVGCELGYARRNCESVAIDGTEGSLRIENPNASVHVHLNGARKNLVADWLGDTLAFGMRALRPERSMLRYTIRASLAGFFDGLSNGQPFSPNFDDAIENASCLEAAVRSISEDKFIEVTPTASSKHV